MEDIGLYAVRAELYEGSSMGIVIICPLKTWMEKGKSDTQYLFYVIRDSKLMEQFGGSGMPYEDITMVAFQDQVLFSSRKGDNRALLNGSRDWEQLLEEKDYYRNITDMESGFSAIDFCFQGGGFQERCELFQRVWYLDIMFCSGGNPAGTLLFQEKVPVLQEPAG